MGSFVETKIDLGSALHGSHDYFFAVVSKLPEITPLSVILPAQTKVYGAKSFLY